MGLRPGARRGERRQCLGGGREIRNPMFCTSDIPGDLIEVVSCKDRGMS